MSKELSLGYLVPAPDIVTNSSFEINFGEHKFTDLNAIPDWDYETPVGCKIEFNLDLPKLLSDCGFTDTLTENETSSLVGCTLLWHSTRTKRKGASRILRALNGLNTLDFQISGDELGSEIRFTPAIVLLKDCPASSDIPHATRKGTRLWTGDPIIVPLEGSGSRFSIAPVSFVKSRISPENANWRIELSHDTNVPISSGIRALINLDQPLSKDALEKPTSPEAKIWRKHLENDVLIQMLLHGIAQIDTGFWEVESLPGSLGEGIKNLFNTLFPFSHISELAGDYPLLFATVQGFINSEYT